MESSHPSSSKLPSTPDQGYNHAKDSSLLRSFRRFIIGSSSPKSKKSVHSASIPQDRSRYAGSSAVSLPPYLAHLESPSRHSRVEPEVAFPTPRIHNQHAGPPGQILPPPPSPPLRLPRVPSSNSSLGDYPLSLRPGPQSSPARPQPYPWELVPQQRHVASSGSYASPPRSPAAAPTSRAGTAALSEQEGLTSARQNRIQGGPRSRPLASQSPSNAAHVLREEADSSPSDQCWGIKQDGTRCTRKVRVAASKNQVSSSPSKAQGKAGRAVHRAGSEAPARGARKSAANQFDAHAHFAITDASQSAQTSPVSPADVEEVYCFQHVAEVNKTAGFYTVAASESATATAQSRASYIRFEDWFDASDLSKHTQALLRRCMSQSPSDIDRTELGYLYIYELRDRSTATHICLKVGRTVNVFRRLGQWRSQCQSKDPLLRAFLPSSDHNKQGLLSGADAPDQPAVRFCHKWERLVHLELSDIGLRISDNCQDCGSKHREIFMIPRSFESSREGFALVVAIAQKWLDFTYRLQ